MINGDSKSHFIFPVTLDYSRMDKTYVFKASMSNVWNKTMRNKKGSHFEHVKKGGLNKGQLIKEAERSRGQKKDNPLEREKYLVRGCMLALSHL